MNKDKDEKKLHNSNFIDACENAVNGIIYATTTQSNIKKQLVIAVIVMILSLFFDLTRAEFLCLCFAVVAVLFAEMVNTAIETIVDLITEEYHPKAKIAKDVGAGAVVLVSLNAVIVAYFLFFEKIGQVGTSVLDTMMQSRNHMAFVSIMIAIIAIVAMKAVASTNKNKLINNKCNISGQTALAFAVLTAIWLNTKDIVIFVLTLILSVLIAENRVKVKSKSLSEIIFSSAIGVLIVLLVYSLVVFR